MFSGGDYHEVGRWLLNFVAAHAKREWTTAEAVVETAGPREGRSYGVRLQLGQRRLPPEDQEPIELSFSDVAARRGSLAWCHDLAARVRGLVRELVAASQGARQRG